MWLLGKNFSLRWSDAVWDAATYYAILTAEALLGVFSIRLYEEAPYEVLARPTSA